jgi:hypothetical protein
MPESSLTRFHKGLLKFTWSQFEPRLERQTEQKVEPLGLLQLHALKYRPPEGRPDDQVMLAVDHDLEILFR